MAINLSRLAYSDCYDLLEKAISSDYPTGLRVLFATRNEAIHFRQRLHNARYVDRLDNTKVYSEDHPMYGRSVYDILHIRCREMKDKDKTGWWLRLERVDTRQFTIVALEPAEDYAGVPPYVVLPEPTHAIVQDGGNLNLVVPVHPIQHRFKRRF